MPVDERLLLGTGSGMQYLDPLTDTFRSVKTPASIFIIDTKKAPDGDIYALSTTHGLLRISSDDPYTAEEVASVNEYVDNMECISMTFDNFDELWITTSEGVFIYDPLKDVVREFHKETLDDRVLGVCCIDGDNMLVSTVNDVYLWVREQDVLRLVYSIDKANTVTHVFDIGHECVYVSVRGRGLLSFSRITGEYVGRPMMGYEEIDNYDVSALYTDPDGDVWVGCYMSGLLSLSNEPLLFNYVEMQGQRHNISAMLADDNGCIWLGSNNAELQRINADGTVTNMHTGLYVRCLYLKDGDIWAGLFNRGLVRISGITGNIAEIVPFDESYTVNSVVQTSDKRLYYSTQGYGLNYYDRKTGNYINWPAQDMVNEGYRSVNNRILKLFLDDSERLWIAHNVGVSCLDTRYNSFISLDRLNAALEGHTCTNIIQSQDGLIWLGTENGLYSYNPRSMAVEYYSTVNGFSNASICGIEVDDDGNIWCSTQMGINRLDPLTGYVSSYCSGNGLVDRRYNTRISAKSPLSGNIAFASNNGITMFNPRSITQSESVKMVKITGILLNNAYVDTETMSGAFRVTEKPILESDRFRFGYTDNSFVLELSSFNHHRPEGISFEYSFNPERNGWISSQVGVNRINIIKLGSGRHKLYLRARENGTLSETSVYEIRIMYPWYASPLSYVIYALIAGVFIWTLILMSKRNRNQKLREAQLKSFTNIAHEICSPMTMVISPLNELMSKKDLDSNIRTNLRCMNNNANRILNLVNQLLAISRYEEGDMKLKYAKTDFVKLAGSVSELFNNVARQHGIEYTFSCREDNIYVWIDGDSMDRVLMNLISNAFKYTPDGGEIIVSVSTGTDDSAKGNLKQYLEVKVADTGIGLEKKDIDHVFDRFYRSDNSYTSMTLGMGIGLNLCKIIVEMHGGSIWADNRTDSKGSVFSFRLPLGSAHLNSADIVEEHEKAIQLHSEVLSELEDVPEAVMHYNSMGKSVLVIDDDEYILDYISNSLSQNFRVVTCKNGKDGQRMAISAQPDLIITDVMMPGLDGLSLVKALKTNSGTSHIPVILLSARNGMEDRMTGLEVGADAYLSKPFYMSELRTQAMNLIGNRLRVKGKFSGELEQKEHMDLAEMKSGDTRLMERIMKVVDENLSNTEFTVEMLCDKLGISRTQLHRRVKDITGISVGRFIQNLKMQRAENLLRENNLNVSQIASEVGFTTSSHFSTTFRNHFGVSPSEYQRLHAEESKGNAD